MIRTLLMVSHQNYNLDANMDFVIFLTFKLNTCCTNGNFTSKMRSQSIAYLFNRCEHIYIEYYGTLKVKGTRYGICG